MKKIATALLAVILIMSMVSCNIYINKGDETTDGTGSGETAYAHENMTVADLADIIATYEDWQFTVGTFKYFFMDAYSTFVSNYYYYLSYYGLDTSAPLHDQVFDSDTGKTWYEYFLDSGKSSFEQYAKFAIKAKAEDMSLSESEIADIEDYLDGIEETASGYDMTFEEYMSDYMGEGMTKDVMRVAVQLSQLGYLYYQKVYDSYTYTAEQIQAEYEKNLKDYAICDYETVTIKADYDDSDDEAAVAAAKADATEKADKFVTLLKAGKTFAEAYAEIYPAAAADETTAATTENADTAESTDTSDAESAGDTTAAADNATDENKYLTTGATYSSLDSYSFIYDEGTKVGDIKTSTDDSKGDVTIVRVVTLPYKDTTKTINVRHILLDSSAYDTEEAALAKAEELLKQLKASDDPLTLFKSLVTEYSSDTGSSSNGGLYEKVAPGKMVDEFDAWCFEDGRKVGDMDIVKTTYGYHIMFFDGFNEEVWYTAAETALRDADFETAANAVYDSITLVYNETLMDAITK